MSTVTALLTNTAYGYPTRGARRRITAPILACIHITGNRRTAANPDRRQAARDERNYANRAGSNGPSAHYYVARDGWAIEAIDPARHAAWSNGDVASPNTANPGIGKVLALRAKGYNPNEAYWLEFECVGYGSTYPITKAQKQFCATQIATMAKETGLPINRATVHGHGDLNNVNRASCPSPKASREALLGDVIARANAILRPPITTVTVKAGDTLSRIAAAHKLTVRALLAFPENGKYRTNPGLIHPGRHRPREVIGGVMDSPPGTVWGREPAMVLAFVQAVIALVVAFGLNLAPDQIGAILAVTSVILGLITRSRVSPAS